MFVYVIKEDKVVDKFEYMVEGLEVLVVVGDLVDEYFGGFYSDVVEKECGMVYEVSEGNKVVVCKKEVENIEVMV